ncbi:MAG: hypothetical protein HUU34_08930 [Saprospiraceae bacterium]|jgi:hypothetical protein|nr:hypothetical protein [Saprospiraceae bacterium]
MKKMLIPTFLSTALILLFSCDPDSNPPEISYPKSFELSGYSIDETQYRVVTENGFATLLDNSPLASLYTAGLTETLDSYLPDSDLCGVVLLSDTEATLHACNGESVAATYSISGDDLVFTFTEAGGGQIGLSKTSDFSTLKICNTAIYNSYYDEVLDQVEYILDFRLCSDDLNSLFNDVRAEQNLMAGDTVVVSYVNFLFPEE